MSKNDFKKGQSKADSDQEDMDDDEISKINASFSSIAFDKNSEIDENRKKSRGSSVIISKLIHKNDLETSISGTKRKQGFPNPNTDFGAPPSDEMDITKPASITAVGDESGSPLLDSINKRRR